MTLTENPDACMVLVTCGTASEAETMARTLVLEKMAACVNVIGRNESMQSFYMWEETLQQDTEVLMLIKTRTSLLPALYQRIQAMHRYEVPEYISFSVQQGATNYLQWLQENTIQTGVSNMF